MRGLVAFLLAVLGCSLAEGGLLSKCELRNQLINAINDLPTQIKSKGLTVDNLVAKIVCHAELASDFNTSAVNQLTPGRPDHGQGHDHSREKRDTYGGFFSLGDIESHFNTNRSHAERPPQRTRPTPGTFSPLHTRPASGEIERNFSTNRPHARERRHAERPPQRTRPTPGTLSPLHTRPASGEIERNFSTNRPHARERRHAERPPQRTRPTPGTRPTLPQLDEEIWTLYGLFQLSNHLVCSDGTTPSPNICGIDCNSLVDDNTQDDITCLLSLFTYLVENGFGSAHWEELVKMIKLIYQEECRDKQASEYFAECS